MKAQGRRIPSPILDVVPQGDCPLCGMAGTPLHDGVPDGFGLTGNLWRFKRCPRRRCGHSWLDPSPTDEALPVAYADYPVHAPAPSGPPSPKPLDWTGRAYGRLLKAAGIEQKRQALDRFLLPPGTGERLLEVGCGNGTRLAEMRAQGYQVEGQEVSPVAAATASTRGIHVHLGDLDGLGLSDGTFDIVVMNHVLEHVRNPQTFLDRCRRLLVEGGTLISILPNGASLSHRLFGPDWVGLDPPRHLHVFTPRSAANAAGSVGFRRVKVSTTYARNEWWTEESLRRRALREGRPDPGPNYRARSVGQLAVLAVGPLARRGGDELILECQR